MQFEVGRSVVAEAAVHRVRARRAVQRSEGAAERAAHVDRNAAPSAMKRGQAFRATHELDHQGAIFGVPEMTARSQRLERGRGGEHLVHGRFVRDRAPAVVADTLLHEVRPAALTKDLEVDVPTRAVGDDEIAVNDRGGVEEAACEQRRHHTRLREEHRA